MADRVVRNGSKDGLAESVAFKSMACPFLYTVKVMLFPAPNYFERKKIKVVRSICK